MKKNNRIKSESKVHVNEYSNDLFNTREATYDEISHELSSFNESEFIEITPLDYEIDSESQKDLSSVSINEVELPKIVYMVVDNKIELETKFLKDYPQWQFLSKSDLNRKTMKSISMLKKQKIL